MANEEWHRERSCTRKRAFKTREYAEMFREYLEYSETPGLEVYPCQNYCGEFHLGHPKNGERQRQAN